MAKYTDRLNELLNDGTLTQDVFDELADLSVAKDAIKEFNQVKSERDELATFKAQVETAPKRKEALKRVGIDYDAQPKYGQKTLDALPADKLDDLDFVAKYVTDEGFAATLQPEQQTGEKSGAEAITDTLTQFGSGQPVRVGAEAAEADFLADLDKVPDGDKEALTEVLKKHNRHQQSGDWEMTSQG